MSEPSSLVAAVTDLSAAVRAKDPKSMADQIERINDALDRASPEEIQSLVRERRIPTFDEIADALVSFGKAVQGIGKLVARIRDL